MSQPVHQHFIPKSYLNNFAEKDQGKAFIHAKRSDDDGIKKLSTRDICVDKMEISLKLTTPFRFKLTTYSAGN